MKKVILFSLILVSFVGYSQVPNIEDLEDGDVVIPGRHISVENEIENDPNKIHIVADEMPKYSESIAKFREFVSENFKNPTIDRDFKGQIILQFIIEKDGSLTDIKVIRDLGYGTGTEAIRVLKKSKKWKAGIIDGKPVRVRYTLPIQVDVKANKE